MKRAMMLLLVALLVAMSATLCWGADKKKNGQAPDSSLKVVIDFKPACSPGDSVLVVVKATGGKKPLVIRCEGKEVPERFYIKPEKAQNFLVTITDAKGDAQAYSLPIDILERRRASFFVGNFDIDSKDITTVKGWQEQIKKAVDFNNQWKAQNIDFDLRAFSWADTNKATDEYNRELSLGRLLIVQKKSGLKPTKIDTLIGSYTKRGVDLEFVETDKSLANRLSAYKSAAINVAPPPLPPQIKEVTKEKLVEKVFWGIAPNELSLLVGQQFGYYTGPTVSLGAMWGHSDSVGFLFSLVGTVGRNSVYHDFKEAYGLDGIMRYNFKSYLGAGVGGGYFYWSDVINNPDSKNYKKYRREFPGGDINLNLFIGPITGQYLWAIGRYDDRRNCRPKAVDNVWQRHMRINVDLFKSAKLIKNIF